MIRPYSEVYRVIRLGIQWAIVDSRTQGGPVQLFDSRKEAEQAAVDLNTEYSLADDDEFEPFADREDLT